MNQVDVHQQFEFLSVNPHIVNDRDFLKSNIENSEKCQQCQKYKYEMNEEFLKILTVNLTMMKYQTKVFQNFVFKLDQVLSELPKFEEKKVIELSNIIANANLQTVAGEPIGLTHYIPALTIQKMAIYNKLISNNQLGNLIILDKGYLLSTQI